jgi:hypothetical protein
MVLSALNPSDPAPLSVSAAEGCSTNLRPDVDDAGACHDRRDCDDASDR